MCGRYALAATVAQVAARFAVPTPGGVAAAGQGPHYNMAPGQPHPVVVANGSRELAVMTWGLVPHWAKEPSTRYSTINARAETLADKPSYRGPLRRGRCLVPATGFYEWQARGGSKQPYYMSLRPPDEADAPGGLFAFAGLYDCWRDAGGSELWTYTIITTTPNPLLAPIHDRMPVILPPAAESAWLDPGAREGDLLALLRPYPAEAMHAYPVAALVNRPACDGPELIVRSA